MTGSISNPTNYSVKFTPDADITQTLPALPLHGNADTATLASTVTTNANLSGVVTSVGNTTSIPNGSITAAMLAVPYLPLIGGTLTGTTTIEFSAPSANAGFELFNTATTGSASNAMLSLITRQLGGGNPVITWSIVGSPTVSYYMGMDNADDSLKIGLNTTVGIATALSIHNSTGAVTFGVPIGLSSGGSGANISPVNGSVVYTDSDSMALTGIGLAGQIFQSAGGGSPVWTTATYPSVATIAGKILRADGTNWAPTTATFADTYAANTVLMSNSANTVVGSTTLPSGLSATNLTLITPTLGAATATSVAFSPTTGGIIGTTTNDNASAGRAGEYPSTNIPSGSAVSISNNTATNVATLSLTAGDWEVYGNICTAPAGGTITTGAMGWISTTSAAIPTYPNGGALARIQGFTTAAGAETFLPVGTRRISLSAPATVYLTAYMTFSASTLSVYGFIGARRAR